MFGAYQSILSRSRSWPGDALCSAAAVHEQRAEATLRSHSVDPLSKPPVEVCPCIPCSPQPYMNPIINPINPPQAQAAAGSKRAAKKEEKARPQAFVNPIYIYIYIYMYIPSIKPIYPKLMNPKPWP